MSDESAQIEYHDGLEPLEKLLAGVKRAGDFFVHGALEAPMPKVEVEGVGVVSFPVPAAQIREIIAQAERAPYGRGAETIVDPAVRKVWQLPPAKVRVGGKSWTGTFRAIMERVTTGLGCGEAQVTADFYKLLVYDEGGFFLPHRDTEKAGGMFGTLVVVLPCAHRGGELVLRHAGRDVCVDLSSSEVSELTFAAFYADCEHEVRPIAEGHRVCLIYNLLQPRAARRTLSAPRYDAETQAAARMLAEAMAGDAAPTKLVWLLEHQYSPEGLAFAALKNADAARVKLLCAAAVEAECVAHLGIVHIEESGPAEPVFDGYGSSRWRDDDEEETDGDEEEEFEIVEVSDSWQYLDEWRDGEDRRVAYGKVPLAAGELLPAGALNGEKPDTQRLMEASGNEGATFERSYHRAALVLWRRNRFAEVLLQAGVAAVLPHLREGAGGADRRGAISLARRVLAAWEEELQHPSFPAADHPPDRAEMLRILAALGEASLLARFLRGVVTSSYDGSENEALAASTPVLGAAMTGEVLAQLATGKMRKAHGACVDLLARMVRERGDAPEAAWRKALLHFAGAIVEALPQVDRPSTDDDDFYHPHAPEPERMNSGTLIRLLSALGALQAVALAEQAAAHCAAHPVAFDPARILIPALIELRPGRKTKQPVPAACHALWRHAATFLLERSAAPPERPRDWRQDVRLACTCVDCRELQRFARDPAAQVHRCCVRQDRRQHLHRQIEQHRLDMTHETERSGRPQTLVCTKTRRTYDLRCEQYRADQRSFAELRSVQPAVEDCAPLAARMTAATARAAAWAP